MEIEDHTPHPSLPILASQPLSRSKKLWYVLIASIIGSIAVIIIHSQSELLISSIIGIFLGQAIGYFAIAGLSQDANEYSKWIIKAADQGDTASIKEIQNVISSVQSDTTKNANEQKTRPIASKNLEDADTDFLLGMNYLLGKNGFQKDQQNAVRLFRKSAEFGYAPAQYMFGLCYKYGGGIAKDSAEYANWVRKAADQGESQAIAEIKKMDQATP